jgi:hypothetical protein
MLDDNHVASLHTVWYLILENLVWMPTAMDGLDLVEFFILYASVHVNWKQINQWFWFTDD